VGIGEPIVCADRRPAQVPGAASARCELLQAAAQITFLHPLLQPGRGLHLAEALPKKPRFAGKCANDVEP
jgi:hypothetical protein